MKAAIHPEYKEIHRHLHVRQHVQDELDART